MRGRPKSYTERQRFMIRVFFLCGFSHAEIAKKMTALKVPMSAAMVSGQIAALGYRKKEMPREVRQRLLDKLMLDLEAR
jgi:hypothetical protein